MDYRQLLLEEGLAKCKNQKQQHHQWQQHLQLAEEAGSGIRQLEVATRQPSKPAGRQPQNVFPICQTDIIFLL